MKNPFVGISTASKSTRSRYINPGHYTLAVIQPKLRDSENPTTRGRVYFIVDFRVVETTSETYQAGDTVSWLVTLGSEQALGDVKEFAGALIGGDESQVTDESTFALCQPDNPASGLTVKCEAFNVITQAGNDFTKINWFPA